MSLSHGSLQRTVTCTPPKGKKKKKGFRAHELPGGEGTNVVETLYVSWWRITGYPETLSLHERPWGRRRLEDSSDDRAEPVLEIHFSSPKFSFHSTTA